MSNAASNLRRLKYAATINDEALSEETEPDFELQYVDIGNVDSSGRVDQIATYRFDAAPSRARRIVRHGDVIISTVRTYLQAITAVENPPNNLIVSTGFAVVRPRNGKLDASFCKFAVREPRFLHEVVTRSVGVSYPAINASDLGDILIPLPPLTEQRAIAGYLDRETGRLDALVVAKERWLELLTEKRRALIARAVTRGLNRAAPLRDSGFPWLGQIPNHWTLTKFKYHFKCGMGQTILANDLEIDAKYPVFSATEGVEYFGCISEPQFILESGDLVIPARGISIGAVKLVHESCVCTQTTIYAKRRNPAELQPEFIWHFLLGNRTDLFPYDRTAIPQLTVEHVLNNPLLLPPLAEQRTIVAYIGTATAKLDSLRAAAERTIALLKERRAALIAAAVTGKIKVPQAA